MLYGGLVRVSTLYVYRTCPSQATASSAQSLKIKALKLESHRIDRPAYRTSSTRGSHQRTRSPIEAQDIAHSPYRARPYQNANMSASNNNNLPDATATAASSGTATPYHMQATEQGPSTPQAPLPAAGASSSTSNARDSLHLAKARIPTPPQEASRSHTQAAGATGSQDAAGQGSWPMSMLTRLRSKGRDAAADPAQAADAEQTNAPRVSTLDRGSEDGTPYAAAMRRAAADVESQASDDDSHGGRRVRGVRDVGTALVLVSVLAGGVGIWTCSTAP